MEKFGVENLTNVVVFAVESVQNVYLKVNDDKKLGFFEALSLIPDVTKLIKIIENGHSLKDEWLDLSALEKASIMSAVQDKFDLADDLVEEVVELSLSIALDVSSFITKIVGLFTKDSQ
tara:strand:+ start:1945 stop:2301 length:357 start_codon:yes stop_codon:yes gene_type:complete